MSKVDVILISGTPTVIAAKQTTSIIPIVLAAADGVRIWIADPESSDNSTQLVASNEFHPDPQNERQREVEARLLAMVDDLGGKHGLHRRNYFFQRAVGMANVPITC